MAAIYDTDWLYKSKIIVHHTAISSDLTDFPVYVRLSDAPSEFFTNVLSAGEDVRLVREDGLECAFDLVFISTGSSTGELHFKAPLLSNSSDTIFWLVYGNANASAYLATDTYGSQNVWTNGFIYVNHMQSITGGDSVGNGGVATGVNSPTIVAGKLAGNAIEFNGTSQYMTHPDFAELAGIGDLGISGWLYSRDYVNSRTVVGQVSLTGTSNRSLWLQVHSSVGASLYGSEDGGGSRDSAVEEGHVTSLVENQWQHFIGWYDLSTSNSSKNHKIYIDGVEDTAFIENGDGSITDTNNSSADLIIARLGGYGRYWDGYLDELRIFDAQRSDAWMAAEHTNQNTPTSFYTFGPQELNTNDAGTSIINQSTWFM